MGRSSPRKPFTSDYVILEIDFPLNSFTEYISVVNTFLEGEINKSKIRYQESLDQINADIKV